MLRTLAIGTLIMAGGFSAAYADVYRWVDPQGIVHYTDEWVPGSVLIKMTKPHPESALGRRSTAESTSTQRVAAQQAEQNANAQAVKQDLAKTREKQCKDAQDRYEKAINARRIFKSEGKDGEREYMSEEEIQAYRVKARNEVQEACGAPPKPIS